MTELIFIALVVVISITLIVYMYLTSRWLINFVRVVTATIKLNEASGSDMPYLSRQLDAIMKQLKVRDYSYYIFFLNTEYSRDGKIKSDVFRKFVCSPDFAVYFEVVPPRFWVYRWYRGRMILEVIFLLIRSNISVQIKSAEKAFQRSAEIQAFINHDVKNLIQFVNVLEYNLQEADSAEDSKRLVRYLKKSIPGLKSRADRVLAAVNSTSPEMDSAPEIVDVFDLALTVADSCHVTLSAEGAERTEIKVNKRSLSVIFENIIKNFYDKSREESGINLSFSAEICKGMISMRFADDGTAIADCEKIFEPFVSGREQGLGIGLFHSRNLAVNMGGRLWAENTDIGPVFILELKTANQGDKNV